MAYVERLKRGNKTYYYLTKNIRKGKNKWQKKRSYVGNTLPTESEVKKFEKKPLEEKDEWMLGEDIPDVDMFFSQVFLSGFTKEFRYPAGKEYKKLITIYKGYHLWFYYLKKDSNDVAEGIVNRFTKEPGFAKEVNQQIIIEADKLRKFADSLPQENIEKFSNKELWKFYQDFDRIHTEYYQWSWIPVAVDMFHNNLTNRLKKYLCQKGIDEKKLNEYFIILTQPTKKSLIQVEQEDFLKIAIRIQQNKKQKEIFKEIYDIFEQKDAAPYGLATHTREYEQKLENRMNEIADKIDKEIYGEIERHFREYFYVKHMWIGKEGVNSFYYYLKEFVKFIGRNSDAKKMLREKLREQDENNAKRSKLIKNLGIRDGWKILFDEFGEFMITKIYRRYAQIYAIYRMQPIIEEIAKRLKISKMQARFMLKDEVKKALIKNKISRKELKKRIEFCAYITEKNTEKVYTGKKAQYFAKIVKQQKQYTIKELKGQTGCIGRASGKVKIIIRPSDMHKMQKGDILVSIATDPDIVPAMKKAAAIVTEQGGVTSHAAIVSREMNIPCVIGTKIATSVLKDGDEVEVDATKGTVRIIK